ncbi:MAG: hypothetical protein ACI8RZ_006497 [Myxococcota bacterium]|jgi:hypothetical protein
MQYLSSHAHDRSAQRSISSEYIDLAFIWGRLIRQPGKRVAFHLGRRETRSARRAGVLIPERAIGTIVVEAADGAIVTVIRSTNRRRLVTYGRRTRSRRGGIR